MRIFINIDRESVRLKEGWRRDGHREVAGMAITTVTSSPAGRPEARYTWVGHGSEPKLLLQSCPADDFLKSALPDGGPLPDAWTTLLDVRQELHPMYDLGGPGSPFQWSYQHVWLVCPYCRVLHRSSSWTSEIEDEETVLRCPNCRAVRDVELVYEQIPHAELRELAKWRLEQDRIAHEAKIVQQLARLETL